MTLAEDVCSQERKLAMFSALIEPKARSRTQSQRTRKESAGFRRRHALVIA